MKAIEEDKDYFSLFEEEIGRASMITALQTCVLLKKTDMLKFLLTLKNIDVNKVRLNEKPLIDYSVEVKNIEMFKMLYLHKSFDFINYKSCIYNKVFLEGTIEQMEFLINDHTYHSFFIKRISILISLQNFYQKKNMKKFIFY